MKKNCIIYAIVMMVLLSACSIHSKKPFGAENIDYERVEEVNKEGPVLSSEHSENVPPMAEKVIVENGPWHQNAFEKIEPTADMDESPEYGDVPIFVPEHNN